MKDYILRFKFLMILMMVMNVVDVQGQELPISDAQHSGCMRVSDYEEEEEVKPIPTIILEKEGNILSVQVQNFISNCATQDFEVNSSITPDNEDLPCTLSIHVVPVIGEYYTSCECPFNVSFTVHDLEQNSFYLDCWWYDGLVELEDGETLVLEDLYEDVTIDDADYSLRKTMHQAMLKKNEWVGEVSIPSEVIYKGQTYSVTSIDRYAFRDNTALTKVTFPRTVQNMDFDKESGFIRNPFIGCTALESIEVEEGNPALCAIDGVLFNKEKTRLHAYPIAATRTSYTVPESVTWIENTAFAHNQHLVKIVLPDEVTILGSSVFSGCKNLEEVRLSPNLGYLLGWAFANCEHLQSVTIPEGVTSLGGKLFYGCTSLTSIVMPESVTKTYEAIFENCTSLKNITLSPNLDEIGENMFLNCSSLSEIQIPEGLVWVRSHAFENCSALKTLDLPESVTRLGWSPFIGCKLDSLIIRGILESNWVNEWLFKGMGTQTKVFVQPSEVEKFKKIYKGPVYPISDEMSGISDFTLPEDNSSALFDLQGRQIFGEPSRGIYIHGGKKIVVK